MAFQGTGLLSHDKNNYFSFTGVKPKEGKLPHTSEVILSSNHTYIMDSRQRDTRFYPNPNQYALQIGTPYKNVTSIELKAAMLPKTEYNVHNENNKIDFNIMDFITFIRIKDKGYGYNPDISPFTIPLSSPPLSLGAAATAQIFIGPAGGPDQFSITNVIIVNSGQGYVRGYYGGSGLANDGSGGGMGGGYWKTTGPTLQIPSTIGGISTRATVAQGFGGNFKAVEFDIVVGEQLTATIPLGQYDFASMSDGDFAHDPRPGLCNAITTALQEAVTTRFPSVSYVLPAAPPILGPPAGATAGELAFPIGTTGPLRATPQGAAGQLGCGSCYLVPNLVGAAAPFVNTLIDEAWLDGQPHNINGLGTVVYPAVTPNASFMSRVVIQRGAWSNTLLAPVAPMQVLTAGTGTVPDDLPVTIKGFFLELLWGTGTNRDSSAMHLLGYGTSTTGAKDGTPLDPPLDQCSGFPNAPQPTGVGIPLVGPSWATAVVTNPPKPGFNPSVDMPQPDGSVMAAPIPFILGRNHYNLLDYPSYVVLSFQPTGTLDRIESEEGTLDEAFAVLLFDANHPNVVWKEPLIPDGAGAAAGTDADAQFSSMVQSPGVLKALKGYDFDKKIMVFEPPVAKWEYMSIAFKKFNGEYYDFHGKDHLLIFEIGCNDINTGNRW